VKAKDKYDLSEELGAIVDKAMMVNNKLTLVKPSAKDIHTLDANVVNGRVTVHFNGESWYNIVIHKPHHGVIQITTKGV